VDGFRRLDEQVVHDGAIWRVVVADFEDPGGGGFRRDIVRSPGAVAVVPVHIGAGAGGVAGATVTLVRQFRPAVGAAVVEIPAGMRDVPGESTQDTARRELEEEVGLRAERLTHLIDMLPSPGMTDAVTTVYLATGLTRVPAAVSGPEEEHMEVFDLKLDRALELVATGEIRDAKTVCGLLLTAGRLGVTVGD
jgi:8-oxo-dGDP phosphatase